MDIKQVVTAAREHLEQAFESELVSSPTLEEIWFESETGLWNVTMGLSRKKPDGAFPDPLHLSPRLDYKVVQISDADGKLIAIKHRDLSFA